jgi:hypothetical protein
LNSTLLKLKTNRCGKNKNTKNFYSQRKKISNYGEIYDVVCLAQDKCRDCSDIGCFFFVFLFFISSPLLRKSRPKSFLPFFFISFSFWLSTFLSSCFLLSHNHFDNKTN